MSKNPKITSYACGYPDVSEIFEPWSCELIHSEASELRVYVARFRKLNAVIPGCSVMYGGVICRAAFVECGEKTFGFLRCSLQVSQTNFIASVASSLAAFEEESAGKKIAHADIPPRLTELLREFLAIGLDGPKLVTDEPS